MVGVTLVGTFVSPLVERSVVWPVGWSFWSVVQSVSVFRLVYLFLYILSVGLLVGLFVGLFVGWLVGWRVVSWVCGLFGL